MENNKPLRDTRNPFSAELYYLKSQIVPSKKLFKIMEKSFYTVFGPNPEMYGDCSKLKGDCTYLRGECSGLKGDCTNLEGDATGLVGNLDLITMKERDENPDIRFYVGY